MARIPRCISAMLTLAFSLLVTLLAAPPSRAETIVLKDGSRIHGRVVAAGADSIHFETPDGILVIHRERIQTVDYSSQSVEPTAAPAPAEVVSSRRTAAFLEGGYRFPTDEAEGGILGSVGVLAPVSETVFLGASVGVSLFKNEVETLSKGDVTLVPLMGRIIVRMPRGISIAGGLGYVFAHHGLSSDVESLLASVGLSAEEDVNAAPCAEISVGYTALSGKRLSAGFFFGYRFHEPNVDLTITDLSTGAFATGETDVSFSAPFLRGFFAF